MHRPLKLFYGKNAKWNFTCKPLETVDVVLQLEEVLLLKSLPTTDDYICCYNSKISRVAPFLKICNKCLQRLKLSYGKSCSL